MVIILVFLAFLGVAFTVYSAYTTQNYKRLRLEGIEITVEHETEKVNKKIAEIERGAIHFAISGLLCLESRSVEVGELSVIEYLRDYPAAEGGGFWFEPYAFDPDIQRFGIYAHYDETEGFFVMDQTMYSDGVLDIGYYDYHSMSWYREIIDEVTEPQQVAWTRPYLDDSGSFSLMTTAGAGIFDYDGNLIGMSNIDWKIEDVVKELSAVKPTDNSFVLLCAPERNYIISYTHKEYGAAFYSAGAEISSLPWDINAASFMLGGVSYAAFSGIMDNGWFLSVCIPENEIFAEMESQNSRFSLIIAFSAAAMLCAAFMMTSMLINKPLKRLTAEVAQIGLGNLDMRIGVRTRDELGTLAETFNKMTTDLKESVEQGNRVLLEKESISAELNAATKIQASMLPCIFPPFPERTEFDIYARMLPAEEVGGDFYDFMMVDDATIAIVIADVSDKGMPAALFMVVAKTLIKNNAQAGNSPKEVFETVNNILCENNDTGMFVTAFLGYLDIATGKLTFVNAGHNPPLLRRNGRHEWLRTKPNIMLAAMRDRCYEQHEVVLNPGDGLFLYTDGVTEASNGENELFGEQRLIETANAMPLSPVKEFTLTVQHEVDKFAGGTAQSDDITMLALSYVGIGSEGAGNKEQRSEDSNRERTGIAHGELVIEAKLDNLDFVLDFVGEKLEGFDEEIVNRIEVAVDEIFTNVSRYAYHPASGSVTLRVTIDDAVATIEFEDSGREYDPLTAKDPDITLHAEDREPGGLGIFMVKHIMDSMEYHRVDGKNILVIKKRL